MLVRIISGTVFVAIITAFFLLREFVDYRLFACLLWFLSLVGTIEVTTAMKKKMSKIERVMAIILGVILIPFHFLIRNTSYYVYVITFSLALIVLFVIVTIILVLIFVKKRDVNLLQFFYPNICLLLISECNYLGFYRSFLSLLLMFVVSSLTDTMAYFVGLTYNKIRKGKAKKLCPKLSPKKTIAGSIGGLIGGVMGGLVVFFVFNSKAMKLNVANPLLFFIIVSFIASIFTQLGDLFESYVKRSVGIKDMGSIMPGHGGVMDRIDGITFAGSILYLLFLFI